jgi:sodium-independent sulfate anion transporter 11
MPPFSVPPFSINIEGVTEDFMYMIERLGTAIIIIPIIAILEDVAIAKAFGEED